MYESEHVYGYLSFPLIIKQKFSGRVILQRGYMRSSKLLKNGTVLVFGILVIPVDRIPALIGCMLMPLTRSSRSEWQCGI